MNEIELAKIEEKIFNIILPKVCRLRPEIDIKGAQEAQVLTTEILNTPFTIEGGVCSRCKGGGKRLEGINMCFLGFSQYWKKCYRCEGTGKLADKTFTIKEAIERMTI